MTTKIKQTSEQRRDLTTNRLMSVRAASVNEESRSFEATMTTETPCAVFDWKSWDVIDEVLVARGGKFPSQVPLLEAHCRYDLGCMRGSARNIRLEGDRIAGTAFISTASPEDERAWNLVREGHLTDVSIGYVVKKAQMVDPGETKEIGGRSYTAGERKLRVATEWELRELSLVPIGADAQAKIRAELGFDPNEEKREMADEPKLTEEEQDLEEEEKEENEEDTDKDKEGQKSASRIQARAAREQGVRAERERIESIRALAGNDVDDKLVKRAIDKGWSPDRAGREFLAAIREGRPNPVSVTVGEDLSRGQLRVLESACVMRMGFDEPDTKLRAEAQRYVGIGLRGLARECLHLENKRGSENADELYREAVSTGSFAALLSNVQGKNLARAYEDLPGTAMQWCGERSVSDFKQYKDVRLAGPSSVPDLGHGGQLEMLDMLEAAEAMQIGTVGGKLVLTRQMFINDDLNAFMRIPVMLGRAARRSINSKVYALLTSASGVGPTMAEDSKALFHATHTVEGGTCANYGTGAGSVLGDTGMAAAKKRMRLVKDEKGAVLNLTPKYLLVPAELEHTALKLLNSTHLMGFGGDTATQIPTANTHFGTVTPIIEPLLDSATNGTTAWYLICDPAQCEHIVILNLNGNKTPYLEPVSMTDVLGQGWKFYFDVAAAAINWRGIDRSKGA